MKKFLIQSFVFVFWVVTWKATWWEHVGCPQPKDPWTGAALPYQTLQLCGQEVSREMSTQFESREAMRAFLNTKPEENKSTFSGVKITNLTVEEIHE